jgi:hypothetical protein
MKRSHKIKIENLKKIDSQNSVKNLNDEECGKIIGGKQDKKQSPGSDPGWPSPPANSIS